MTDHRPESKKNLTATTIAGLQWTTATSFVATFMQVGYAAAMGRLLDPFAFGLVGMGSVVLRFVTYFSKMGLSEAIVQRQDLTEDHLRAGFGFSVLLGASAWTIVLVLAPLGGLFFREPAAVPVIQLMGAALLVEGSSRVSSSMLKRGLRFRTLAIIDVASYFLGYLVIGIGLAVLGAGVYSLVWASISQALVSAVWKFALVRHPLRPIAARGPYRDLFSYGARVSVISFLEWLSRDLDTFAIGRWAGTAPLGLYNRAYHLARMPLHKVNDALAQVLFPSFSAAQGRRDRLVRAYLTTISVSSALVLPACAGMAVAAYELVIVVYGDQWASAVPILPWFMLASALSVISRFSGTLLAATAVLTPKLILNAIQPLVLAAFLWFAIGGPVEGYAAALSASWVFHIAGYMYIVNRYFGVTPRQLAASYLPGLMTAGLVAGAIASGRWLLLGLDVPLIAILAADVALGALTLALAFWFGPLGPVRQDLAEVAMRAKLIRPNQPGFQRLVARMLRIDDRSEW